MLNHILYNIFIFNFETTAFNIQNNYYELSSNPYLNFWNTSML